MAAETLSVREVERRSGVPKSTIARWGEQGDLPREADGRYPVAAVELARRLYEAGTGSAKAPRQPAAAAPPKSAAKAPARASRAQPAPSARPAVGKARSKAAPGPRSTPAAPRPAPASPSPIGRRRAPEPLDRDELGDLDLTELRRAKQEAEIRERRAKAEAREIEVRQARGELVDVEEVRADAQAACGVIRTKIMAIAPRVALSLEALLQRALAEAKDRVHRALCEHVVAGRDCPGCQVSVALAAAEGPRAATVEAVVGDEVNAALQVLHVTRFGGTSQ